jgi:hypothetical protein
LRGFDGGCTVNNQATGTYSIAADGSPFEDYNGGNIFNNAGVFIKTAGAGNANVHSWTFKNSYKIVSNSGSIVFDGGELDLNAGGLVMGLSAVHFTAGTTVLQGATLCLGGHGIFDGANLVGHADGTGTLSGGRWDWASGTWSGVVTVAASSSLVLSGTAGRDLYNNSILDNYGAISVEGSGNLRGLGGCRFNNHAGATFAASALPFTNYAGGNVLTNDGAIVVGSPLSAWSIDWDFAQSSTGSLSIDIGGLAAGTQFDQVNFHAGVSLGGALNVSLVNSYVPALNSTYAVLSYPSHSGSFATFNSSGAFFSKAYNSGDLTLSATNAPANLAEWKTAYFGDPNSPNAADNADPDHDGIPNLLEYAMGSNPLSTGSASTPLSTPNGGFFDFHYSRSVVAMSELQFQVQWNDGLTAIGWSSTGISETILSDNGTVQQVSAHLPTDGRTRRFARLAVTKP